MTLYVVTSGEYSDYQIEAIFSEKEEAEKYIDTKGTDNSWDVEEYELNPTDWKDSKAMYRVIIDRRTGEAVVNSRTEPNDGWDYDAGREGCFQFNGRNGITIWIKGDSCKRVKKVASEMWMQIQALRLVAFPYLYEKVVDDRRHFDLPCHEYPVYNFYTKKIVLTDTQHLDIPDPNAPNMMEGVVIL